ncbi:hypothetical protein [Nonomuraea sp. NPDC049504]|jgi:hypothetical protein|uniref:hypothetical protein n=1 Tax=Nonomuraea sp. NPDC049504 TaxID=3154729 RepID=UPI00343291D5
MGQRFDFDSLPAITRLTRGTEHGVLMPSGAARPILEGSQHPDPVLHHARQNNELVEVHVFVVRQPDIAFGIGATLLVSNTSRTTDSEFVVSSFGGNFFHNL